MRAFFHSDTWAITFTGSISFPTSTAFWATKSAMFAPRITHLFKKRSGNLKSTLIYESFLRISEIKLRNRLYIFVFSSPSNQTSWCRTQTYLPDRKSNSLALICSSFYSAWFEQWINWFDHSDFQFFSQVPSINETNAEYLARHNLNL